MDLTDPKIAQLDLAYHDIRRGRGVFDVLARKGLVARVTTDEAIDEATSTPPQTTRAKLRGDFITAAQKAGRDFTVDWVHLKINDMEVPIMVPMGRAVRTGREVSIRVLFQTADDEMYMEKQSNSGRKQSLYSRIFDRMETRP